MTPDSNVQIQVSQTAYERLQSRAAQQSRTVTDVVDDVLRQLDLADEKRRETFRRMGEAIARMQEQSVRNGIAEMTMDEINEEIALARKEAAAARVMGKAG